MWICKKCDEAIEDEFDSCWKCRGKRPGLALVTDDVEEEDVGVETARDVVPEEERIPDRVFAPGPCRLDQVVSCWHKLFDDFSTSSLDFYADVEEAIARRKLPGVRTARLDYHEGGFASAKREYLRVRRDQLTFDVCAAPFGTGFFFSWWLSEKPRTVWPLYVLVTLATVAAAATLPGLITRIVIVFLGLGVFSLLPIIHRFSAPRVTYYRMDSTLMFQATVKSAVEEAVDAITSAKGLRPLTAEERKPIMRGFFGR